MEKSQFTCPAIENIADLIEHADRRERAVRDLIADLKAAKETQREVNARYVETLAKQEGEAVQWASVNVSGIETQIDALGEFFECGRAELPRVVREAIIQSDEMRRLLIDAYEAKAAAAEKLIEPAREGLLPRIAKFFSGSRVSAEEASQKASRVTAEGQLLAAVTSRVDALKYCAVQMRQSRIDNIEQQLETLRRPLPSISDFEDRRH